MLTIDGSCGAARNKPKGTDEREESDDTSICVWDLKTWQKVAPFRGCYPYGKVHYVVSKLGLEYITAYVAIKVFPSGNGTTECHHLSTNLWLHDAASEQFLRSHQRLATIRLRSIGSLTS
jgi:hypothetical protein